MSVPSDTEFKRNGDQTAASEPEDDPLTVDQEERGKLAHTVRPEGGAVQPVLPSRFHQAGFTVWSMPAFITLAR